MHTASSEEELLFTIWTIKFEKNTRKFKIQGNPVLSIIDTIITRSLKYKKLIQVREANVSALQ